MGRPPQTQTDKWDMVKGNQLVMTADTPTKWSIVQMHHDPPAYSHPGISRTYELTARRYWWPHMQQDVTDYIKGCADCQQNKVNNQAVKAPLSPIFAKPRALPSKQWPWTSLLSYHCQMAMTQYSQSWTMTAQRWSYSSHAMKQ